MSYLGRGIENLSDRVVLDSLTASATASYTLQLNSVNFVPSSAESLTVSLNGVIQAPISSYTVSGSSIVFASTLSASDSIDFIIAERGITLQTPSAGSVGTSQLASDSITAAKINFAEATLTDQATITWNAETEDVCKVTLGDNRTLAAPTNGTAGQFISILVIQDGTGSRTLTWNAVYEFKDDTAPTLTTTASKGDVFVFRYNGTKWLEVGRNLNLTLS